LFYLNYTYCNLKTRDYIGKYGVVFTPIKQPKREEIMETYRIIRIEKIEVDCIIQAKNEKQAMVIFEDKKMENPIVLSSETDIKKV